MSNLVRRETIKNVVWCNLFILNYAKIKQRNVMLTLAGRSVQIIKKNTKLY
jgi:hypothetical protein